MNHEILLDLAQATARYAAYARACPQKNLPLPFLYDTSASVLDNLDRLAIFALHPKTTTAVLHAYREVFLEVVARWIEKSDAFEAALAETQGTPEPTIRGSVILLALSRVVALFPESVGLIEYFMAQRKFALALLPRAPVHEIPADEMQSVLLALHRIYAYKPQRFVGFVLPQALYHVLSLDAAHTVAKYLAVLILARYLNASEVARSDMLRTHTNDGSLTAPLDGGYKIDYRFLDIVEAKRLLNHTSVAPHVPCNTLALPLEIRPCDLSQLVISICGVLVACPGASKSPVSTEEVVPTQNAVTVLRTLACAVQNNRPVLLHGQAGSGKTFLVNLLARYLGAQDDIVKIHLGEQTDAKLLLGTYTSGEKPGSFEWRSGVLTTAVREGKWVLVEDIDKAPTEVLSILLTLLEKRELSIPSRGEVIRAHSGFKLLSTVRTSPSIRVPDMIGLRLWLLVPVAPPSDLELRAILATRYPLLRNLIAKFISVYNKVCHIYAMPSFVSLNKGSHPRVISTRDLMKVCSRCHVMLQNKGVTSSDQLLEAQVYDNIFAEAVECFGSAITEYGALAPLVSAIGEVLEIPASRINLYLDSHVPSFYVDDAKLEIGRAVLVKSKADKAVHTKRKAGNTTTFARTKHSKRLMEQIAVGIEMIEPILLVGETGTGKTTVVQEVAKMMHKKLTVINVSQQTEAGDLLGGYKPVNTKSVATPLQEVFETLFLATFSQKKNGKFSALLSKCFNKNQWKNVIKLWTEAVKMAHEILSKPDESDDDAAEDGGPKKKRKLRSTEKSVLLSKWQEFQLDVKGFESQAANLENSFVFSFVEGSLVKAVRNGEWLLLDEINLASPDTLESIADLLSENLHQRSVLLSERGDVEAIKAHADFRIFGCMNPSTDVGKRDLPLSIRSRFSEIYVHSPDRDREDLTSIIEKYILRFAVGDDWAIEDIAELYYEAKTLAESNKIVDGANQKPHFSIRTLTRTLIYVCDIVSIYGLRRALYEGFCMSFLTLLDRKSEEVLRPIIAKYTIDKLKNAKQVIARCPPAPSSNESDYVQFKHYWMKRGPGEISTPNYIITPFVEKNLLNLVRATASRKFPVLVQGPTSAGKTSMINYLASITGHKFVRINNHEHTDLQEYLGTYVSDSSGKLVFREGVLVEALRKGHWIVLDELNLAPTDVLEALNRLLDDNRELFIPETQEVIHPHPDFMLFATQNPPGLYGGRKVLSRAFRNRFLELHFDDIPQDELEVILRERCQIAPSYGKKIVEVYRQLSVRRQSSRLFEQKNSFATLRDLFRWALRDAVGYEELAANGYMLLAERVRSQEEKLVVKETIEKVMRVTLNMDEYYEKLENKQLMELELSVVWTKAMRRLAVLVEMSIKYKEPLLLVGETGCGKTTVCQILAQLLQRELITVNAHQNTETGDILGAQRPIRNRFETRSELLKALLSFFDLMKIDVSLEQSKVEDLVKKYERVKRTLIEVPNEAIEVSLLETIDEHIRTSSSLFEWADGPLINAMKQGEFFLLDEISLADDSVLERLNSVLEPERSLLLAEKGTEDSFLAAEETFQFLASMNPGGDYGKKELSPALRNRFTEIWVPSMDDFNDVQQIVESRLKSENRHLSVPLVKFSEWFGRRLGNGNANSGVISLRDILAWVEFINSCDLTFSDKLALVNGAMMVFIDALGTNNTAYLADNQERLLEYKQECLQMLCLLIGSDTDENSFRCTPTIEVKDNCLKAGMFQIPRKPETEWEELFNLLAPTTAANAMRVIRAMQVHKPILLEGSPGVGKTSLISAISKATGNPLIRINLSEQTDLIDLFGSDAPVEGGNTGEFVWRDAPFLRAMKNGEWVLLDEMNLASQSVLEGLNACLDHRGEAYIPELDRSFPRHPQFKVFAAQNPQYQGGGRKGLPKSFVNRFSVVHMDVLKNEDLMLISAQIFPNVPRDDCSKIISFMTKLEEEVVVQKKWGMSGGPWEFNLRDTLRWLGLYSSKYNLSHASDNSVGDFLDMIVCHRFRTPEDRQHVEELFESIFGPQRKKDAFYGMGEEYVQAGGSLMKRSQLLQFSNSSDRLQFVTLQTNFPILESAMRSVNENIPLILTGPSNAGKTELIRFLANIVGVKLSEFSMNSDVDSMDILGGYEQVDLTRSINALTLEIHQLLNELVVVNLKESGSEPASLLSCLELLQFMEDTDIVAENFHDLLTKFQSFLTFYSNEKLDALSVSAEELHSKLQEVSTVKFNWFDGMLVKAVVRGEWLVLDNANLCNPSVLDRLNSLLEYNGSLIINECSQEDGSPRILKPHPNFRLFLTVDPRYGELSRAMRNRCVEIFLESLQSRATSFDRMLLGMPITQESSEENLDATNIDQKFEKMQMDESLQVARPISAFVSSTDSSLRQLALVHDCVNADSASCLASALVSIFGVSQFGKLKKWAKAFNGPEFGLVESARLEQVCQVLQHLQASGFVSNMKALYGKTAASLLVTRDFASSQVLHPLVNPYLLGFFVNCGFNVNGTNANVLFQVAASVLDSKFFVQRVEEKAINGKASELSFIERSAAIGLGREIKRAPKINIYAYVKAVAQFISNVFDASMNFSEFFQQPSNFYESLMEIQCIWVSLTEASQEQNLSKLRVYHGMITSWLETHESVPIVADHSREITSLSVGLELTSGFSMTKIWEHFRQSYPTSKKAWDNYAKLLALLGDFDVLSRKLYPDTYGEVSELRHQMLSLYEDIVSDSLNDEDLDLVFTSFATAFKRLADVADAFVVERHNLMDEEFTMLSNFLTLNSYYHGDNLCDQLSVASYASKSTLSLLQSSKSKLFTPYPRIFDCLWSENSFAKGLFTNVFLQQSIEKVNGIKNRPGKYLDQSLADMSAFGKSLIQNSPSVLENQKSVFQSILFKWILEILKAHDLDVPLTSHGNSIATKADLKQLFEVVECGCDETVVAIMRETYLPALYLLIDSTDLAQLGKAWILFASGCIQLFVPNSPLDPAIEDHVTYLVYERQQELCIRLAESWKTIRSVNSGDEPLQLESSLPKPSEQQELSKSQIFRTNESMDELFDEWKSFMDSAIDTEPIAKLLTAAELSTAESNHQKVGIFHNNSANFMMRLNSKYPMYADLNDILNGYIYSIRLGLDLLNIENQNRASSFSIVSLWQVNIEKLNDVPAIEAVFRSVKAMNKTLGSSSVLSEKVMLFFINLCFAQTKKDDEKLSLVINQAFQSLYYRWYYRKMKQEEAAVQEGSLYKHKDTDDAEQEFKDLFPDYDDVMDIEDDSGKLTEAFEDVHYELAVSYVNYYLKDKELSLKNVVEQGALLCTEFQLVNSDTIYGPNNASHLSALLITMKSAHDQFASDLKIEVNFYHDACPSEFKKAMKLVLAVFNSVASLLTQWPEHATLQTISRYASEFLGYPSSFPLNKLLFKVEVLHNSLNEWEKFASSKVTLKAHSDEITNLIVSWRKLELTSWKSLFNYENKAFQKSVGKWWFHLFDSIVIPYLQDDETDEDINEKPSVVQILGALNIFMSQTNFGDFQPRLDLVKALRNHIASLSYADSNILNGLGNFISFYEQFVPTIEDSVNQTRKTLEKDVSEIILLASWKDVNIDALKQSSRKSHNSLYKLVRKYRTLLSTPVSPIIEAGIPKDSAVIVASAFEPKHLRHIALSQADKLAVLKACQTTLGWSERPARLKNIEIVESNLKIYIEKILKSQSPSLYAYTKQVIEQMEELRKETPSVMNDETKK
ncbi:P-loop containing nucleoside triphosphate hydrolase protein, partial [Metschnikowia bicuspidata var. bicuspidata NRRL YB-4993]